MARILIIDDDEMVRVSLDMILRTCGWQTELADGGEDGLGKARRSPPGLVLCDLNMRGMSGLELLVKMRQDAALKSVPVLMMTGSEAVEIEHNILQQGAQAVLLKPFDSDQLSQLVRAHLHHCNESGHPNHPSPSAR
jgi:DNA-binding response OmpR family regulator